MKNLLLKYKFEAIGFGIGAITGFAYWYFVGCASGTCMITSNPFISTIYGSLMGIFLFGMFRKKEKETNKN